MTKYTNINGIDFETHASKYAHIIINSILTDNGLHTLEQCYTKPSETKRAIYNEWREWYLSADNVVMFGIRSCNNFCFNLAGIVTDENTGEIIGVLNITKTKNELILI